MNFSIIFAVILAVCYTSDATFFGFGRRQKKKNGLGYLADIGGAVLRYAPDFYDVLPKQLHKFIGGGHKKHKHHDHHDDEDYHHHHHKKHHHHDHDDHHHEDYHHHGYGHYFDSAAYYGLLPHHSPYTYPHHGSFLPEFHDFNDIAVHPGYDFDDFHHQSFNDFNHFY